MTLYWLRMLGSGFKIEKAEEHYYLETSGSNDRIASAGERKIDKDDNGSADAALQCERRFSTSVV